MGDIDTLSPYVMRDVGSLVSLKKHRGQTYTFDKTYTKNIGKKHKRSEKGVTH